MVYSSLLETSFSLEAAKTAKRIPFREAKIKVKR